MAWAWAAKASKDISLHLQVLALPKPLQRETRTLQSIQRSRTLLQESQTEKVRGETVSQDKPFQKLREIGIRLRFFRAKYREANEEYKRNVAECGDMGAHGNSNESSAYTLRRCEDEINRLEREAGQICEKELV